MKYVLLSAALMFASPAQANLTAQFSNNGITQTTFDTSVSPLPIDGFVGLFQLKGDVETVKFDGPGKYDNFQGFTFSVEVVNHSDSRKRLYLSFNEDQVAGALGDAEGGFSLSRNATGQGVFEVLRDFGGETSNSSAGQGLYSMTLSGWLELNGGDSGKLTGAMYNYPVLPEPSTWALVVLGFGVVAFTQMTPRIRRLNRPGARISDVPNPPTM
jgi:hypothetical protein